MTGATTDISCATQVRIGEDEAGDGHVGGPAKSSRIISQYILREIIPQHVPEFGYVTGT